MAEANAMQMALIPPPKGIVIKPMDLPEAKRAMTRDEELTLMRLRRCRPGSLSVPDFKALRIRGNPMRLLYGLHNLGYPVKRAKDADGEWYFWIEDEDARH